GLFFIFFFSSRRRHTRFSRDWSSDVCSSDLQAVVLAAFLPVLSCLAGNNGCQALAITLRGLTLNDLARHPVRVLLAKEVRLGARSEERRVGKECRARWAPCR